MQRLRSDTAEDILYLILAGKVTASDVCRLERDAVVAARVLDEDFCLVTDISDCEHVSTTATEQIQQTVEQLHPFGLYREVHIVDDETPTRVQRVLDRHSPDWKVNAVDATVVGVDGSKRSIDVSRP